MVYGELDSTRDEKVRKNLIEEVLKSDLGLVSATPTSVINP